MRSLALIFAVVAAFSLFATSASAQEDRRVVAPPKRPERDETWLFFDFYGRMAGNVANLSAQPSAGGATYEIGAASTIATGRETFIQGIFDADLAIGGGDDDLSGVAHMYGWVGLSPVKRGSVRPFLRTGAGFDVRGNDTFYYSRADLPMQLGVRLLSSELTWDGGAFAAYTGTGRFNVQDYERNLDGTAAWGGFLDARSENKQWPFLARAEYRSYGTALAAPTVRMGSLKACLVQWEIAVFCLDSMAGAGTVNDGTGLHDAWIYSGGFSVGLGLYQPTREL
jgi:hypothetical protein